MHVCNDSYIVTVWCAFLDYKYSRDRPRGTAVEATYFKCNRQGHHSSQCLSTTVAMISVTPPQPQVEEDIKFLDTIESGQDNI